MDTGISADGGSGSGSSGRLSLATDRKDRRQFALSEVGSAKRSAVLSMERTLHGQVQDLSEHRIGSAVFGKPQDYSVVEDSSVRVHVRQLRLKLHEYFDGEGREETAIVEIPKGAYTTLFRPVEQRAAAMPPLEVVRKDLKRWFRLLPWALAVLFFITTLISWFRYPGVPAPVPCPWPLAALFDSGNGPVQVVVADINYGMTRLVDEKPITLDEYLSPAYRSGASLSNAHPTARESRVMKYLSGLHCSPHTPTWWS